MHATVWHFTRASHLRILSGLFDPNLDQFLISELIFQNDIRVRNAIKGGWNYRERFNYLLHPLISHWHTNKYPLEMSPVNSSDIHLSPE